MCRTRPLRTVAARRSWRPLLAGLAVAAALPALGGCVAVASVSLQHFVTGAGIVSVLATGKGLADHALDLATQKDCRILEGLLKGSRKVCEEPGSPATADDFEGLTALLSTRDPGGTIAKSGDGPLSLRLTYPAQRSSPPVAAASTRQRGEPLRLRPSLYLASAVGPAVPASTLVLAQHQPAETGVPP